MIMTIVDWSTYGPLFTFLIALLTAVAGIWMLVLGYWLTVAQTRLEGLGNTDSPAREAIRATVRNANAITEQVVEAGGNGAPPQPQEDESKSATETVALAIGPQADLVRALAELAKSLNGLTPAVSAFVVSTILFITAGTIVIAGL